MEFYDGNPALEYFTDEEFVVKTYSGSDDKATLFVYYDVSRLTVSASVYDQREKSSSEEFIGATPEEWKSFLVGIEDTYDVSLPKEDFIIKPMKFFNLASKGLSLYLDRHTGEYSFCETCGEADEDTVAAFYFPPLSSGEEESFGVYRAYGCFGGVKVVGLFKETAEEGLRILEGLISSSSLKQAERITEFSQKIRLMLAEETA